MYRLIIGITIGVVGMYLWANPGQIEPLKKQAQEVTKDLTEKAKKAFDLFKE